MRQAGLDGALPIWGGERVGAPLRRLSPDYWEYYGFDEFDLMRRDEENFSTTLKEQVKSISLPKMRGLMTTKSKVEELWPVIAKGQAKGKLGA